MTVSMGMAVTARGEFSMRVMRLSSVRPTLVMPMSLNWPSHQETSCSLCSASSSISL